jgi:hypothetical protein
MKRCILSGRGNSTDAVLKGRQARLGFISLGTNKDQLLRGIQSIRTFANLQYLFQNFESKMLVELIICRTFYTIASFFLSARTVKTVHLSLTFMARVRCGSHFLPVNKMRIASSLWRSKEILN